MKIYAVARMLVEENDGGEHKIMKSFKNKEEAQQYSKKLADRADGYVYVVDEYELDN